MKRVDLPAPTSGGIASSYDILTAAAATAPILLLNTVVSGAAFYQRIGTHIGMKKLHLRIQIVPIVSTSDNVAAEWVRQLVVYDRQPNGALCQLSDILLDTDAAGDSTTLAESESNPHNTDRFIICWDKTTACPGQYAGTVAFCAAPQQGCTVDAMNLKTDLTIDMKGLETAYGTAGTGAIGDIKTGSLLYFAFGDVGTQWGVDAGFSLTFADA